MLHYRTPEQKALKELTASEARRLLSEGNFPPGSMGPKVEAAVTFLENTSAENPVAIISSTQNMAAALAGQAGTRIIRGA